MSRIIFIYFSKPESEVESMTNGKGFPLFPYRILGVDNSARTNR
jgi:hypothetical protein